ncbi:hypothetical protein [Nosocomiicoccus sp. HMSC059G07]|uniref:hypothetical protein n=1 Tax=Nosocomiicoccus sp. HMSC059G07 TaxID=1739531 RepID=UPI0008A1099E|nr:hypothetical protein [Nosocomiicoccus sp. HMSC059G07]OFO55294.1 hypothetical protein HMPREF3029_04555 [Nosocomiicoccus sp. HMSC059G07]
MNKKKKRIYFYLSENELNELEEHLREWSSKYSDRTEFINKAISNLISLDENKSVDLLKMNEEVKRLKTLLELNLQFTYSMMERQELKVSNLYYGDSLRAIKGKEAINGHYRNKLMNENKIQTKNNVVEENKNKNRITIDDL